MVTSYGQTYNAALLKTIFYSIQHNIELGLGTLEKKDGTENCVAFISMTFI